MQDARSLGQSESLHICNSPCTHDQIIKISIISYHFRYTLKYVEGQIAKSNAYYGGKNFNSKCVIFVHGTWDPWHTQGVTTPKAYNTVVLVPGE